MEILEETLKKVQKTDKKTMDFVRSRFNDLYLGMGNLGELSEMAVRFAGISRNEFPKINKCVIVQIGKRGDFNTQLVQKENKAKQILNAQLINFEKRNISEVEIDAISAIEDGINFIKKHIKESENVIIPSISQTYENKLAAFCIASILCKNEKSDVFENIEYLSKDIEGISVEDAKQALEECNIVNNSVELLKKTGTYDIWSTMGIMLGAVKERSLIILSDWISILCAFLVIQLSADAASYFILSQVNSLNIQNELSKKLELKGNIKIIDNIDNIFSAVLQKQALETAIYIYSESVTKEEAGIKND